MPIHSQKSIPQTPQNPVYIEQEEEVATEAPILPARNNPDAAKYAKELAFLGEEVEIMISPSYDQDDTTRLVTIGVNGKSYYFMRGEWRKAPRFVLEILATTKADVFNFGYKQAPNGATVQTTDSHQLLRFPHQFRDLNPEGLKWYDTIKNNAR